MAACCSVCACACVRSDFYADCSGVGLYVPWCLKLNHCICIIDSLCGGTGRTSRKACCVGFLV
jgi:hypothetical protein